MIECNAKKNMPPARQETSKHTLSLKEKAQKLYASGVSLSLIAEVLDVSPVLLLHWSSSVDFKHLAQRISMRWEKLKELLAESFAAQRAGQRPPASPKDLLQYASAYEKLSVPNRHLGCWFEAYETLSDELLHEIASMKDKRKKHAALRQLRFWRNCMQRLLVEERNVSIPV